MDRRGRGSTDVTTRGLSRRDPSTGAPRSLSLRVIGESMFLSRPLPSSGTIVVGRSAQCDVVVDEASVSRRHVAIHVGPPLRVEDLGGTNGTRVGERTLGPNESSELAVGELVEIGAVMIAVQPGTGEQRAPAVTAPPPPPRSSPALNTRTTASLFDDPGPAMAQLLRLAERVALGTLSILVLGETGVGKELMAEMLHACSPRAARPFMRIHCGALTEALLESELFGHEKGAFTGAVQAKPGLFEVADGGTVFLDEVGELTPALQVKLLRVLEDRRVQRVGSVNARAVDVRYIAATNRTLEELVARGEFRADLYYRLNGITLLIPPLRERPTEIPGLARHFVALASEALGRPPPRLDEEVLARLVTHRWPGNVRELRNVMDRAVLLCAGDVITVDQLGVSQSDSTGSLSSLASPPELKRRVRDAALPNISAPTGTADTVEHAQIVDALARCAGNQTQAAKLLGISRNTLLARLDEHGLPRPRKRSPP